MLINQTLCIFPAYLDGQSRKYLDNMGTCGKNRVSVISCEVRGRRSGRRKRRPGELQCAALPHAFESGPSRQTRVCPSPPHHIAHVHICDQTCAIAPSRAPPLPRDSTNPDNGPITAALIDRPVRIECHSRVQCQGCNGRESRANTQSR